MISDILDIFGNTLTQQLRLQKFGFQNVLVHGYLELSQISYRVHRTSLPYVCTLYVNKAQYYDDNYLV